ncbi:DNA helicase II / ATP-dependent DNA helicase PcrA [Rhizoctonia solani]|uniref:DNA 3'-5' helicase n=1 Tax=Rhizoctonia solani TaxID=456999 RepID=A0A0K6FMY0_9AGAM|nr:DNA helicase II / ATP-dependent DNA helicase PcrA [Rhizoctonia solani]
MTKSSHLQNLNEAQYRAVTFTPAGALQILAGPDHGISASSICAVTFTNKAAAEMRIRLTRLIGPGETSQLVIGTFHAICANYLRKYGTAIRLATNFSICDSDESKKTIATLLQKYTPELESASLDLKEPVVRAMISKAKATGQTPQEMLRAASSVSTQDKIQAAVAHIYEEYDAVLREANALDFDDLLVMGLKVLKAAPRAISKLRHVVVDEFQDTNIIQYQLMRVLADACGGYVSVVGDPDQSIYGWRSADVTNLSRMRKDKQRVQKSLFTSHARGPTPLLREFESAAVEASFLARELRRVVASSGGMIGYGDCAILLRFNALSRVIEAALQQESVPSRVLGGHKFFERAEVKDVLVYLQLADNPAFTPAFVRAVNVPKRGVGEKSIAEVVARATSEKTSAFNVIERICDGTAPDIKPPIKRKVSELVRLIRQLRKWAAEGILAADLIRRTVDAIGYEAYLRRTQPDWETRWENVQELVNFAAGVEILEPDDLIAGDNEAEDLDNMEDDTGGYPSDNEEPITGGTTSTSASSSGPASNKLFPPTGSGKRPGKRLVRPSGSEGRDTTAMKQATLLNWRSASRSNSTPPLQQQPESSPDDDVLDLTGTDDEETLPQKITDTDAPTKKLLRPRRDNQPTPLRAFLQASLLSTDSETKEEESKGKVTITTCHAAKGLEWPVVIVPAVEGGTYPFYRAEDVEEERRLLYVACTRAQALLYLTHSSSRMVGGETRKTTLSEFVSCIIQQDPGLFQRNLPLLAKDELAIFGKILSRAAPTDEAIQRGLREFRRVPRLRDHERDESVDPDEASEPSWKYTTNESKGITRAVKPSSIAASREGFTSLSLSSIQAFDLPGKSGPRKTWINAGAGAPRLNSTTNSEQTVKPKSASGLAYPSLVSTTSYPTKPASAQTKPPMSSTIGGGASKTFTAPPKPANSAFRPPTFIARGATPNAASTVTGVKRRLGMGHLAGGTLSVQKLRKVEKEGLPGSKP